MKPRLLGLLAAAAVVALGLLFWRDAVELWHVKRLASADPAAREAAAEALIAMKSPRGAIAFVKLAGEDRLGPGPGWAQRVLAALDDRGFERLPDLLEREPDRTLALYIVEAAAPASVEPRRLLPVFRRALAGTDPWLRRWALEELGNAGPAAAGLVPEVRAALRDPEDLVRFWAEIALAKIAPEAVELVDQDLEPLPR
jgi:HEAT repeat protein